MRDDEKHLSNDEREAKHHERFVRTELVLNAFERALDEYHRVLVTVAQDERFLLFWSMCAEQGLTITLSLDHEHLAYRLSSTACPRIGGK